MMRMPLGVLAALVLALPLHAQERVLEGTVVDLAGAAMAGQVVVLHTVTAEGGRPIGEDTTDAAGRFALPLPGDLDPQSVAFAAVRLDGRLYLGPMLQGGEPPAGDYVVTAGGESALDGLGAAAPQSPAARPGDGGPTGLAFVVFVPLAALIAFFVFRGMSDPAAERRRLLVELAEVEERRAGADTRTADELDARRAALLDRLGRRAAAPGGPAV